MIEVEDTKYYKCPSCGTALQLLGSEPRWPYHYELRTESVSRWCIYSGVMAINPKLVEVEK